MKSDKTLLITGGTGSLGNAVLRRFMQSELREIRIFSRDEKKQDDMRHRYAARYPQESRRIRYYLGDIRDPASLQNAMDGVDLVFHAAALKQVPSCEAFPMEAVKTNVAGAENVLRAAIQAGVQRVVCLSTDKAVQPASAMGISKAMMEKIACAMAETAAAKGTSICCARLGNVLYTRGSVLPLFVQKLMQGEALPVTDPTMTRFIMTPEEAVDLVAYAFENGQPGDLIVPKASACTLGQLVLALQALFGVDTGIHLTGVRPGEKRFETLMTAEEATRAQAQGPHYRIPIKQAGTASHAPQEFTSTNADLLSEEEIKKMLLSIPALLEALDCWKRDCQRSGSKVHMNMTEDGHA